MSPELISSIAVIVSLCSLWLSYRSYENSKSNQLQFQKKNAHTELAEWKGKMNEIQWKSLFVEREIDELLKQYSKHPELLMWRSKTEGWAKLSKKTLQAVDNTRNHLDKLEELESITTVLSAAP